MKIKLTGLFTALWTLTCLSLPAQPNLERIDSLLAATMEAHNVPAVSMAIVYHGETYFLNRGTINRRSAEVVNEHSLYQIGSLGKTFVGVVVHQLLREGKLQRDQPITDYLEPDFRKRRWAKLELITIEDLLHHTSGFPQDARIAYRRKDGTPYNYAYAEKDFYEDLAGIPVRRIGEYQYSNFNYALLAHLAGIAAGRSFPELLKAYVLKEIGAVETTALPNDQQRLQLTVPYRKDERQRATEHWNMGLMTPPSGLYSSAHDLAGLLRRQISAYRHFTNTDEESRWYLTRRTVSKGRKRVTSYGYGLNQYPGGFYGHAGDMDGYAVDYSFNPAQDFGVVLLTSSGEDWINPLIRSINRELGN